MTEVEFIKDHPSGRFKKGQIVKMPKGNVDAWLSSGYVIVPKDTGEPEGNVESSLKDGEVSKENPVSGGESQKKSGKKKKKKRNR